MQSDKSNSDYATEIISVTVQGEHFNSRTHTIHFTAGDKGRALAIQQALEFLVSLLPEATVLDHFGTSSGTLLPAVPTKR